MTKNSSNFNVATQRGRFYVDAKLLQEEGACRSGLARYLEVFGEKRYKFNKTFIRKAAAENLNLYWLAYKADSKYGTHVERSVDSQFSLFFMENAWDKYPTKKRSTSWWIEAFTEAGYI